MFFRLAAAMRKIGTPCHLICSKKSLQSSSDCKFLSKSISDLIIVAFGKSNPISVWIKWIPMNLDYIWLYYHTKPDFALFSEKFSKKMKKANRYGWLLMTCILPWIWIFKEKSYICIRIAYFQFGTLKYIDALIFYCFADTVCFTAPPVPVTCKAWKQPEPPYAHRWRKSAPAPQNE